MSESKKTERIAEILSEIQELKRIDARLREIHQRHRERATE